MLTVVSTHGNAFKQGGSWKVQCRFTDGSEGCVSAPRKSVLRKRLSERGVSREKIDELFQEDE